jgi:hypothetical protein
MNACEHYDRYLPGGLFLILGKSRYLFGLVIVQPLALLAGRNHGPDLKALAAHFNCRLGVGDEVVVPRGILGASAERGDYDETIAISGVRQWPGESSATLGAGRRQEEQRSIRKLTTHLPLVRPEFTNHLLVEIIPVLGGRRSSSPQKQDSQ